MKKIPLIHLIIVLFIALAGSDSVVHMCFQLGLEVKSFQRKSWSKTTQWGHATFNYCGNIALMWSLSSQKSLRKLLYVPNGELGIPIFSRHPLTKIPFSMSVKSTFIHDKQVWAASLKSPSLLSSCFLATYTHRE